MPIKFVGKHPSIEWIQTGFYSLDIALRKNYTKIGWPTRTLTLVYGPTSIGKSTFVNSISMVLANRLGVGIADLDLETQDPATIEDIADSLGYGGEWIWISPKDKDTIKDKSYTDEYLLKQLREKIRDNNITILDSVASVVPISEFEGDVGARNVGHRAFNMSQYSKTTNKELKWSEKGVMSFMISHRYKEIATGLPFATYNSPGGEVKENMAFITIQGKVPYVKVGESSKKLHFGDGWVFEGHVEKNRHGISDFDFWVYIVGGHGIHKGLTAMFDCVKLNLAKIASGGKLVIKDTGEDLGRISAIIADRDNYDFTMFYNLTKSHQLSAEDDAKLKAEDETVEYVQSEENEDENTDN